MQGFASNMQFEKAEIVKKKLEFLQDYNSKSVIVHTSITNIDVVSISSTADEAYVNYLSVYNGTITHSKTLNIKNGGVAMTAYRDMMFGYGKNNKESKAAIKNALLRYCELDTLAMVIIWEHWRRLVNGEGQL